MSSVAIIDYGMGNIGSVLNMLKKVGAKAQASSDPAVIASAEKLILPGVGAFRDCMDNLSRQGLLPFLRDWLDSGRPFLGICLGLQLLFEESEEFGTHRGIGFFPGKVVRFPAGAQELGGALKNVIAIAAGDRESLALKADGTVVGWGGKYGNGQVTPPEGLTNVISIAIGESNALAIKSVGDRESDIKKRLSAMKDSATGPIGTAAIVFVLLLKFLFLKTLFGCLQAAPRIQRVVHFKLVRQVLLVLRQPSARRGQVGEVPPRRLDSGRLGW